MDISQSRGRNGRRNDGSRFTLLICRRGARQGCTPRPPSGYGREPCRAQEAENENAGTAGTNQSARSARGLVDRGQLKCSHLSSSFALKRQHLGEGCFEENVVTEW